MSFRDSLLIIGLALVAGLFGCQSLPQALTNATNPSAVYELDLSGTLDGVPWEGVAVGSSASSHTIDITSKVDVNYFRIISCHRSKKFEDVIKTGWFAKNSYEYIYSEAPGIEDTGFCVLRLQAFSKDVDSNGKPVGSAFGLMLFHNDQFNAPAENICNGADGATNGTSVCQSMQGLIQRLRFKKPMIQANPPASDQIPAPCQGKFIDPLTWEYTAPKGECVAVFGEAAPPHRMYLHLSFGFDTPQYRGNVK